MTNPTQIHIEVMVFDSNPTNYLIGSSQVKSMEEILDLDLQIILVKLGTRMIWT